LSSSSTCEIKPTLINPASIQPTSNSKIANIDGLDNKNTTAYNESNKELYNRDDNYFENELSLYLDDVVTNLVLSGKEDQEKNDIINMLSSNDVSEQDIENENKFRLLFEDYSESMLIGSQDFRCNSSGCYVSYVLSDSASHDKIFMDFPRIKGSTSSGYTIDNSDGTTRYVDFILSK